MNKEKINKLLEHSVENINKTVEFLFSLQKKLNVPISSGIPHLDKIALGGLLPNSILSIVSRSSMGKSYSVNRIRNSILKNKDDNVGVLLWNLEMPFFTLLLVELKKALKKPLRWIVDNPPVEKEDRDIYRKVIKEFKDERFTKIDETVSPEDFYNVTKEYIEKNKYRKQLFIMIDHIGIIKGKNKNESVGETMEYANKLKMEYPDLLTFIILGQLNREIENRWRQSDSNPMTLIPGSDNVSNSDALLFYSDVIMAQVIPQVVGMDKYASVNKERYDYLKEHFIEDNNPASEYTRLKGRNRIYYHFLKVRLLDGEPTIYCEILDPEAEEIIQAQAKYEKDTDETEEDNMDF